jgi:hypothetical protein
MRLILRPKKYCQLPKPATILKALNPQQAFNNAMARLFDETIGQVEWTSKQ